MNQRSRQLTEQALAHHQAGRLQQALPLYQQAVEADNLNSDAHQFMGLLFLHAGKPQDGIASIRNAIAINPKVAPYHDNLGAALESIGDNVGALASFKTASGLDAENADRLFGMGNAFNALGQVTEAEEAYRKAINLNAEDSALHFNLANLLKGKGALDEACVYYERASKCPPEISGVFTNWGNTLLLLGQVSKAVDVFEEALKRDSNSVSTLTSLVSALLTINDIDRAEKYIGQAEYRISQEDPQSAMRVWQLKGKLKLQKRQHREAIAAFRSVLSIDKDDTNGLNGLATAFRWIQPTKYEAELVKDIERLLSNADIAHQRFARLISNQVRHQLSDAFEGLDNPESWRSNLDRIAGCSLLCDFLSKVTNTDAILEQNLLRVHHALLELALAGEAVNDRLIDLASACAIQSFLNEHVAGSCVNQKESLIKLEEKIGRNLKNRGSNQLSKTEEFTISVSAIHHSLYSSQYAAQLLRIDSSGCTSSYRKLVELALREPDIENSLKSEIESLSPIDDSVSMAVQAQYEQHPYPRWFLLPQKNRTSYLDHLLSLFPTVHLPDKYKSPVNVLSAGCGTGQEAAIIARGRIVDKVIGLDLSATSLAYATRMAKKSRLENLSFIQGDILRANLLREEFAVIETTGVLHHMGDPMAGWRALVDCLECDGLMKVGLYSTRASVEVNQARDWIQKQGYGSDNASICAVRQEIFSMEPSNPLYPLRHSEDFYSVSACRDLIFHEQEQSYTPTDLTQMLEQLNLRFLGFELSDQSVKYRYLQKFPSDPAMTNLENWDQYDQQYPDTFSGMLVFWCQKQ